MIYDLFLQDKECQRINEALSVPGLTYKERDELESKLRDRENTIRQEQSERFKAQCGKYKKRNQVLHVTIKG